MKKLMTAAAAALFAVTFNANAETRLVLPPLPLDTYLDSLYLDYSLGFKMGTPTKEQNVEIDTKEVYLRREFSQFSVGLMIPSMEVSVAQLNANELHGYNYGVGPSMTIPLAGFAGKMQLVGSAKVHWLTRHDFDRKQYGGPVQFTYSFGGKYQIERNMFVEYTWEHMSNGDRYEYNPALETHNFAIGVNF
ncbi:acyloxyacyl hydrolase [Thalassolituus sp. LLYu03]|uniref:acyloxyacyl hydrolase n=1 Tax=Thalassolituus sp. LLYu03 TaxID=3421656 RepID=UPI003D2C23DF